jgi:hypothetical protein
MKNLSDLLMSINIYSLVLAAILIFVGINIYRRYSAWVKEKNLRKNPLTLGIEQDGKLLKVNEVREREGIILLSENPSTENPFGYGRAWYKEFNIPIELRQFGIVMKIKKNDDGSIECEKRPIP